MSGRFFEQNRNPGGVYAPLHHGASEGFDWVDGLTILGALALLAAVGFGIWWLVQKRRYD